MIPCPACQTLCKGECGLLLHASCYCQRNQTSFTNLLQQHQEHITSVAEQERERYRLQEQEQAEREQREREQDVVQAQWVAVFQSLAQDSLMLLMETMRSIGSHLVYLPAHAAFHIPTPFNNLEDPEPSAINYPSPAHFMNTDSTGDHTSSHGNGQGSSQADSEPIPGPYCTPLDANNVFHEYPSGFPLYNPEASTTLDHLCDGPAFQSRDDNSDPTIPDCSLAPPLVEAIDNNTLFLPFLNPSIWCYDFFLFFDSYYFSSLDT
ncbi:hypothetical protein JVU11DRAFT_8402 [Chiua virens]|nr:hypothetical protein JVU11DRAFT_8402 [Chiua virens]